MAPMLDLQVWIGAVPVFPIRQALTASVSAASARPSAGTPGADALPWIGWHGGADRQDDNHPPGRRFRQPPAPIRSSVPPCSGQSRPSPAGGREDAASLDRPCARRLCDLTVGTEECSRRGSNQRMDPTEQENDFNKDRKSLLCPDASLYSAWFLTAVHIEPTPPSACPHDLRKLLFRRPIASAHERSSGRLE